PIATNPRRISDSPPRSGGQLDRPVGVIQECLPALIFVVRELDPQDGAGPRLDGLADQPHAGLARGAAPLPDVAADAGADDVVPGGLAAPAAGDDVVQAELAGGEPLAAILAAVAVAGEDVPAVELDLLAREPVVAQEPDDARDLDLEVDGADEIVLRPPE